MRKRVLRHLSLRRALAGTAGAVAAAVVAWASPVHAETRTWVNPAGGGFPVGDNWAGSLPPATADTAVFDLPGAYAVNFPANATTDRAWFEAGDVTLDLQSRTYTVSSGQAAYGLLVGRTAGGAAALTVRNGTLHSNGGTVSESPVARGTTQGALTVGAGGFLRMTSSSSATLVVGSDAAGTFTLRDGGDALIQSLHVADGLSLNSASSGRVTVTGAGSTLTSEHELKLGLHRGGDAELVVTQGGVLNHHLLYVGFVGGSTARAVVEGVGTAVAGTNVFVGSFGRGELTLRGGAQLTCSPSFLPHGSLFIGDKAGADGRFTITGAGSRLSTVRDVVIGVGSPLNNEYDSVGQFRVVGGGSTVSVGRTLNMVANSKPSLAAVIDATGLTKIAVGGQAILNGKLEVDVVGFAPARGRRYDVLTANGGITGGGLTLAGPDAADFVLGVTGNTVHLTYTGQPGDATGDLAVNFDDLLRLAQNYNAAAAGRANGDFTYDGHVDFDDLLVLAQNYQPGGGAAADVPATLEADWARATSQVPEPGGAAIMLAAAGALGRRVRSSSGRR